MTTATPTVQTTPDPFYQLLLELDRFTTDFLRRIDEHRYIFEGTQVMIDCRSRIADGLLNARCELSALSNQYCSRWSHDQWDYCDEVPATRGQNIEAIHRMIESLNDFQVSGVRIGLQDRTNDRVESEADDAA